MAHLHDMEELVLSIEDNQVKDYMNEALSCYMAKAYRACIVLTYIALFDDIVKKLKELGKVNGKAKRIHDDAQKKINDQEVYESYVIDQLKANALLPALDTTFLDTLRVLRNKSAHPSGHNASAEEARFIFYESINRFLSKPILTTTQLVDEILSRLDEKHFFPSTGIGKISAVVRKELTNIHHEALPYCINKLLEKSLNTNDDIKKNASFFLIGLAFIKGPRSSEYIKKYIIEGKCSDSKFSLLILRIISANGSVINNVDPVTYERLRSVISERINNVESGLEHTKFSHPASVISSILVGCGEDFLIDNFKEQLLNFFKKNILSPSFAIHMKANNKVVEIYFPELCNKAGSTDFETANYVARNIGDIDDVLSDCLSDEKAFFLLSKFIRSADHGAWASQSLRSSKFSSVPKLNTKAKEYLKSNGVAAKEIFKTVYGSDTTFDGMMSEYLLD
ncbi:hypothetical protein HP475_10200 [Serratia marcescens]|nr:hypothetical protein [Serratia marcescens]QLJ60268.1 hypothetical protein HP475_10200 [Serratia marcescens]